MSITSLRQNTLKVNVELPSASESSKLEKKSLVSNIYVGKPVDELKGIYGTEPCIQLNDQIATVSDIGNFIEAERQTRDESDIPQMIVSLKIDENVRMGIVTEIKQELRKVNALHISYSSTSDRKD